MKTFSPKYWMQPLLLLVLMGLILGATKNTGWKLIYLKYHSGQLYRSSSELQAPTDNTFGRYGMHQLFDGDLKTCWAEGTASSGIGETLYIAVPESARAISLANGFQKSRALYRANNRIKTIALTMFVGISREGEATELFTVYHATKFQETKTLALQDTFGFQRIPVPFDWPKVQAFKESLPAQFKFRQSLADKSLKLDVRYILQIKILDVFKGTKYDDTCISEIKIDTASQPYPVIEKVYVNKHENTILMNTKSASNIILDQDPHAVFQIVAVSAARQWVIVIEMPAEIGSSRAETTYVLYNTRLKTRVSPKILGPGVDEMYDFEQIGGKTYLNYLNNKTMEIDRLDLNAVCRKLAVTN
ncbi:MAG: hypothetical protein JRJ79_13815 [Deltaproteobacteria bacterium]|nr:hypothetical protein [Deltaproteobacteria bacterium]